MVLFYELHVVLLLFVVWTAELACKRVNVSPIIGQLAAGLIVGPALLDLFTHVEAFRLLGKLGVMIVVIESGLTVDVRVLRKVGTRAVLVGITGVLLPTLISFALYTGALGAGWKTALAVGASLSPTSLGFTAQLLGEVGELSTPVGQLICTAAVIDDVLALLLLAEVQALGDEDPKWYAYAVPVLGSVGSVVLGILATAFISSKTDRMHAWLTSLNDSSRQASSSSSYSYSPRRGRLPSAAATSPNKTSNPRADHSVPTSGDGAAGAGTAGVGREIAALELATLNGAGGEGGTAGNGPQGRLSNGLDGDGGGGSGDSGGGSGGCGEGWVGTGDRVLLAMVLALSLLFAYLSSAIGSSDLLGCFFGGVAFSGVPGVGKVWSRQMNRFSQWGLRLFFAATVAFSVPSIYRNGGLLRVGPFWKGLVLTVAAVVGKLAVGVFAGPPLTLSGFLTLGWAMNGRGEFSFLIAQEASEGGVLSAEDYSAVVWALLLCSLATPIAFRRVLAADRRAQEKAVLANRAESVGAGGDGAPGYNGLYL